VLARYGWNRVAAATAEVYEQVVARGSDVRAAR
jgi:hypothetical protein